MKTAKIHIRRSSDGQYYFTLNAKNGRPRATSEMYTTRRSVERAIIGFAADFNLPIDENYFNELYRIGPAYIIDHTNP